MDFKKCPNFEKKCAFLCFSNFVLLIEIHSKGHKMQKKKVKNPQPNLFSILDNGNIATNNPTKESDKVNEIQEPLPYVVKTQVNTARMISRNPIEWARYLSF